MFPLDGFDCQKQRLTIKGVEFNKIYYGKGQDGYPLELVLSTPPPTSADRQLSSETVSEACKKQKGARVCPVLIVAVGKDEFLLCGPGGNNPPVFRTSKIEVAKQLCLKALSIEENRHAVTRYLTESLPLIEGDLVGVRNDGFLSAHELNTGTRARADWTEAKKKSLPILKHGLADAELLRRLGYQAKFIKPRVSVLSASGTKIAIALLLDQNEHSSQTKSPHFNDYIPREYAFRQAESENLDWIILLQGDRIRLYSTKQGFGVSKKSPNSCFIECSLSLLEEDNASLLWLLFAGESLISQDGIQKIKKESERYAASLADGLRERVHAEVIPKLVYGVLDSWQETDLNKKTLDNVYEIAINILYRLLLVAYAEDRNYFPYETNSEYKRRSLKQKAIYLKEQVEIDHDCRHWNEVNAIWQAIYKGSIEFGVPEYGGAIFSSQSEDSDIGAAISRLQIKNKFFVPALKGILLAEINGVLSVADFRNLSIRELGSIYEGALENEVSQALQDLTIRKGEYQPSMPGDKVDVRKGEVYIHDSSGSRKTSGSYYTSELLVNYLLDNSLEPALEQHIAEVRTCSDEELPYRLFDFSVADIAMGSGHFLVMAIDRIEKHFSQLLKTSPNLRKLVEGLESSARSNLAEYGSEAEVNTSSVLRRVIAYKCIYGVDYNRVAVNLARLSIWLHTFVPGLPLFLLERNLIHGNSLVGIANYEDIKIALKEDHIRFFHNTDVQQYLNQQIGKELRKLRGIHYSSIREIDAARKLFITIREKSGELRKFLDLCACPDTRTKIDFANWEKTKNSAVTDQAHKKARKFLSATKAVHFPISFPDAFASNPQGFDVVVGNPPWQKMRVRKDRFWSRYYPELRGLATPERRELEEEIAEKRPDLAYKLEQEKDEMEMMRTGVKSGDYPGIGRSDLDFYMAFAWRFLRVTKDCKGRMGLVLPVPVLHSSVASTFRKYVLSQGYQISLAMLKNSKHWVFNAVDARYFFVLLNLSKAGQASKSVAVTPICSSEKEFISLTSQEQVKVPSKIILQSSEEAGIPLIKDKASFKLIKKFLSFPPLSADIPTSWKARAATELHLLSDKEMILKIRPKDATAWAVLKGESFNLWDCDSGKTAGWARAHEVSQILQGRRSKPNKNSPHYEFPSSHLADINTLPALHARIATRVVTASTNRRTMILSLIPPNALLAHANYFLFPRGDQKDEAYLLGMLSSMVLDWYVRQIVTNNTTIKSVHAIPMPRLSRETPLWQRIVETSAKIAAVDGRFSEWAEAVGIQPQNLDESVKRNLIHQLDALAALACKLTSRDLIHIYKTFHKEKEHAERACEVLRYFNNWKKGGWQT